MILRRYTRIPGVRQQVIDMVRSLPDEITVEDITAELYFKMQVDNGFKQLYEGKGIAHAQPKQGPSKWLSK